MIKRDELIESINKIIGKDPLASAQSIDQNANGVQVHGADKVTKIALGVSANLDFFKEAVDSGAEFCAFHHGLHLSPKYIYNSRLNLSQQTVLKYVFRHNLSVAGYHHTLDAHPVIGNNAIIIKKLGAKKLNLPYFDGWGFVAEFPKSVAVSKLAKICASIFNHDVFAVYAGPKEIKRIGVCSGGAISSGSQIHEIHEKGVELHITGTISESGPGIAKEAGFNYFSCGHYATEVFGIQELGKKLKAKYKDKLAVEFIDIPNSL